MQMTVDLRRWHLNGARAGGICNLSAFEYPNIGYEPGRDFDETLARVSTFMRRRKADMPGLSQAPFLPLYYRLSYQGLLKFFRVVIGAMIRKHNFMNVLTNMGPILPELVTFGDMTPTDAWLLVPPIYPPLFGAGLTGYAGTLTLSAGVPESARPAVDAFYDSVLSELPG
jgi:NRPS condensation-like uncharacterized protein